MSKILITGASGFIGQALTPKLVGAGHEVHILERYVTGRYGIDPNHSRTIKHYASLTDYPAIRNIIKAVMPDYVIHLAAISAVSFSYDHYIEVGETDYLGSINLFEVLQREVPQFKQIIVAGTSEEYGMTLNDKDKKLMEVSELTPNSPYAVAKVAMDLYLKYMYMAYGFPYTLLRPYNTYGRTDNTHFFIEHTITQMLDNPTGKVFLGTPDAVRDWLYVNDHAEGYIKAIGNQKAVGQAIQLATGKGYTTRETAELIAKLTGFKGEIVWNSTPQRPLDARMLIGDSTKAKELLGWQPQVQLEDGLKMTIEHYKNKNRP